MTPSSILLEKNLKTHFNTKELFFHYSLPSLFLGSVFKLLFLFENYDIVNSFDASPLTTATARGASPLTAALDLPQ